MIIKDYGKQQLGEYSRSIQVQQPATKLEATPPTTELPLERSDFPPTNHTDGHTCIFTKHVTGLAPNQCVIQP